MNVSIVVVVIIFVKIHQLRKEYLKGESSRLFARPDENTRCFRNLADCWILFFNYYYELTMVMVLFESELEPRQKVVMFAHSGRLLPSKWHTLSMWYRRSLKNHTKICPLWGRHSRLSGFDGECVSVIAFLVTFDIPWVDDFIPSQHQHAAKEAEDARGHHGCDDHLLYLVFVSSNGPDKFCLWQQSHNIRSSWPP